MTVARLARWERLQRRGSNSQNPIFSPSKPVFSLSEPIFPLLPSGIVATAREENASTQPRSSSQSLGLATICRKGLVSLMYGRAIC